MAGIREILVLVVVVLGIFLIPRLLPRKEAKRSVGPTLVWSGKLRLAIAASITWPTVMAAFLQPWLNDPILFFYVGIGPVVLGWVIYWVFMGYRRPRF